MQDEQDDTSSNPQAAAHLPVSGEFDAKNIPDHNPLTTDAYDDDEDGQDTVDDEASTT